MLSPIVAQDLELRKKAARLRMFPVKASRFPYAKEILIGVSVRDIARGTGMWPSTISRLFNGHKSPTLATLKRISTYLTQVKGRMITIHDVIDIMDARPWEQAQHVLEIVNR